MTEVLEPELIGKELLLQDLNSQIPSDERNKLMKRIEKGRYSEYLSHSNYPSTDLRIILEKLGYEEMAEKALCGLYDHEL